MTRQAQLECAGEAACGCAGFEGCVHWWRGSSACEDWPRRGHGDRASVAVVSAADALSLAVRKPVAPDVCCSV